MLTQEENLAGLAAINRDLTAKAEAIDAPQRVVLNLDTTEIPVWGHGAADGRAASAGRIGRRGGEANRSKEGGGRRGV